MLLDNGVSPNGVTIVTLTSILSSKQDHFRSKLAITMLACHLNRIKGVRAVSVDPGAVNTSMTETIAPRVRKLLRKIGIKSSLINAV
uniref:SDR family NAD(P)-dependent oxidoreductase n=1 Tax=Ascaris lumbricoides TaxID=6252 RepID=A0A0M3HHL2_ASCLU